MTGRASPRPRQPLAFARRVAPGALRNDEDAGDDEHQDHARRIKATEREAAVGARLVEEIADGRAERPRQDERRPE